MTGLEKRHPSWPIVRLLLLLGSSLGAVGAVFLVYLALIYPVSPAMAVGILARVAVLLVGFGAAGLVLGWAYLSPVRNVLVGLSSGESCAPAVAEAAVRRAARMPRVGMAVTFLFWIAGCFVVEPLVSAAGVGTIASVAGLLAGACTGFVSGLLVYYLAVAELFPIRLRLPGPRSVSSRVSIRFRVLVTSVAILLVGVALVGASAALNHQTALERAAVGDCARALTGLAGLEASPAALAEAAALACDGAATVVQGDRTLARSGLGEAGAGGQVVSVPMGSGATLQAVAGARHDRKGAGFAGQMVLFAAIALLLAVSVALVASRAITMPVRGLAEGAEAVARGDLSREIPVLAGDEIGSLAQSFSAMSAGLRRLVGNVTGAAESLSSQVGVVAAAGEKVQLGLDLRHQSVSVAAREMTEMDRSVGAVGREMDGLSQYVSGTGAALAQFAGTFDEVRRQGAELEQSVAGARAEVASLLKAAEATRDEVGALAQAARGTLATVGEAGRTLTALTGVAVEGERLAQRLGEETEAGGRVVAEGVRGVEAIRGVVAEARARVEALGARSADITVVVDFIADVAGRTNLLSLNAAIIAAQAGEQGRPFHVVADHIRELAAQIGSSTKRIGDIIAGVGEEIVRTRELIEQSDELAAAGVERAREGGQALERIAEGARKVRGVAASITPAVLAHADATRQAEQLAARVVELAQGFAGAELLVRGGRSIDALAQGLAPLTQKLGQALEEQAAVSHRQVDSLQEINRMIVRLNHTVAQHGEGTARAFESLTGLMELADDDRRVIEKLARAAQDLTRHSVVLREGLEQFRI